MVFTLTKLCQIKFCICRQKKLALAYNNRGLIQYKKVNFHEAVDDYTCSLKFDVQIPQTFYNRGLIHYRLGRCLNRY